MTNNVQTPGGNTTTAGAVEMARRICARIIEGDSDNPVRVMKANRYYEGALDDDHHMAIALAAIIETRDRDAALAYRVCAETRHVTLGDKVSAAIRSGQQFRKDV